MASRECFQNELLLCDVTVLLNFGVSQRRLSVSRSWGRFWIKKNIISLGKWPRSSPAVRRALIIGLFFVVFCLITGLQRRSIVKLSRLSWSTRLKRGSQQTPYTARFCSKLSSVRSPSLEACNFPIVLSRRFHRPIYFYFEFILRPPSTSIRIFLNPQLATFSFRMRLPSTPIRRIRKRIRIFLSPLSRVEKNPQ